MSNNENACRSANVPRPILHYEQSGLWGEFGFRKTEVKTLGEKLGKTRSAMVRAMLDNPKITIKELAGILDISTTAVENNIRYLKSEGYLKRVGPAEGGHWEVLK